MLARAVGRRDLARDRLECDGLARVGAAKLWETNVGTGFSSVSIADGKLYTMGHPEDDDVVWCLDAATGAEVWKFSYPSALVDNLHDGGPAATPTVDGERVYTLGKEGHLFCLNANTGVRSGPSN